MPEIVKIIPVQPGLSVLVEDSHNILVDVTTPDGQRSLARSGAITNVDALVQALEFARQWVAIIEDDDASTRRTRVAEHHRAQREELDRLHAEELREYGPC